MVGESGSCKSYATCASFCSWGFTDEDLDFIINDDIKYRLGQDAEGEADE